MQSVLLGGQDGAQACGCVLTAKMLYLQGPLELLPSKCERVYVGKRGGRQSIKQPEIDKLLVQLCLEVWIRLII